MVPTGDSGIHGKKHHFQLHAPLGLRGVGFLTIPLASGKRVSVELKSREVKLLYALNRARMEDATLNPAEARGWRSRDRIAREIEKWTGYCVSEAGMSAYVVKLLRKVSDAVGAASSGERVPLIERRRKLGFRLAENVELEIIDGNQRQGACA